MKKIVLAASFGALMSTTAMADGIGVSMALFDDNFLTVLRNGIQSQADSAGLKVQIEDAQNDVAKQLDQINNFIASGVDAIIVNPVDTSATQAMSDAAAAAGVPLVYVNRQPINMDTLPDNQAFVASNEVDSGTLETQEVCRILKEAGKTEANIYVIMGELSNQAAVMRTKDIHDVIATPECSFMKIIDEQTSNWQRDQARQQFHIGRVTREHRSLGQALVDRVVGGQHGAQAQVACYFPPETFALQRIEEALVVAGGGTVGGKQGNHDKDPGR